MEMFKIFVGREKKGQYVLRFKNTYPKILSPRISMYPHTGVPLLT